MQQPAPSWPQPCPKGGHEAQGCRNRHLSLPAWSGVGTAAASPACLRPHTWGFNSLNCVRGVLAPATDTQADERPSAPGETWSASLQGWGQLSGAVTNTISSRGFTGREERPTRPSISDSCFTPLLLHILSSTDTAPVYCAVHKQRLCRALQFSLHSFTLHCAAFSCPKSPKICSANQPLPCFFGSEPQNTLLHVGIFLICAEQPRAVPRWVLPPAHAVLEAWLATRSILRLLNATPQKQFSP